MGVGAYEPRMMYKVGFAGVKLNLTSGKVAEARPLHARLRKLRSFMEFFASKAFLKPEMVSRLQRLEDEISAYQKSFWWKRVGLLIGSLFMGSTELANPAHSKEMM